MPANIMRQMLRDKVESFLPPDALRIAKIAEESERTGLLYLAQAADVAMSRPSVP